jgi:hypothetical protein
MLLFQAEERAIKLRKIEENRSLTVQTNHEDTEKPQSLSTSILSQGRNLLLFYFYLFVIFLFSYLHRKIQIFF